MLLKKLILVLILFGIGSVYSDVYASQCEKVDLRENQPQLQSYFEKYRSQGGLDWCWAHAAADLLTYRVGAPVSASDLAFRGLADRFPNNFLELIDGLGSPDVRGFPSDAFSVAKKYGVCLEVDAPSDDSPYKPKFNPITRGVAQVLRLRDDIRQGRVQGTDYADFACFKPVNEIFPHLNVEDIFSILRKTSDDTAVDAFDLLSQINCANRRVELPDLRFDEKKWGTSKSKVRILHEQLSNGNPVIISVPLRLILGEDESGNHALTVFGRELRQGKCEFLVRNTWDLLCSILAEKYVKNCNSRNGTFWMSEEDLLTSLNRIYYLR